MLSKNNIDTDSSPPTNPLHKNSRGEQTNARGEEKNEEYHFITSFGITGLNNLSIAEVFNMPTNNDNDENDDYGDGDDRIHPENADINERVPDGKVADTNLEVSEDPPSSESYSSTNNRNATNNHALTNSEQYMVDKTTDQIIDIETAIINCHDDNQSFDNKMSLSSLFYANEDDESIYSPQLASNGNAITKNIAVGGGIEKLDNLDDVSIPPIAPKCGTKSSLPDPPSSKSYSFTNNRNTTNNYASTNSEELDDLDDIYITPIAPMHGTKSSLPDPPSSKPYSFTNKRNTTNNYASTNSEELDDLDDVYITPIAPMNKIPDQIIDIETAITKYHGDKLSSDINMTLPSLISANVDNENIYSLQLTSNGIVIAKNMAVGGGIEVLDDLDNVSNSPIANFSASPPRSQSIPGDGDYDGNLKVAMMECQCCYVETEFEDMVSCREKGHLFCRTCVRKYVEERVFGLGNLGKTASASFEISCLHLSGCTSGFPEEQMHRVLPEKVMTKYDELRFMTAVEKAAMKDICKCPKCQYLACADESVVAFHCPQCNYKSCRKCGKEAHPQIRCNQVETKRETDGRKYIEEAMTKAKIRTCPKPGCNTEFYKSGGCNKITCPKCSTWICYICRSKIPKAVSYGHFCQTPHCQHSFCGKCPLHSNTEEDDKRAVREARLNAKRTFEGTETKKHVNVDVDSLFNEPSNGNDRGGTGLGDAGRGGAGAVAGAGAGAVVGRDIARRDDRGGECGTSAGCFFIILSICSGIGIFIVIFRVIFV